jgi:hypothetical protein
MWALSMKRELGDVWHAVSDGHAICGKRVRLAPDSLADEPSGYVCKTCQRLSAAERLCVNCGGEAQMRGGFDASRYSVVICPKCKILHPGDLVQGANT